jgi:hypothetical protein
MTVAGGARPCRSGSRSSSRANTPRRCSGRARRPRSRGASVALDDLDRSFRPMTASTPCWRGWMIPRGRSCASRLSISTSSTPKATTTVPAPPELKSGDRRGRSGHRPAGRGAEGPRPLRDHRHRRGRRSRHGPVPAAKRWMLDDLLDLSKVHRQHRRGGQRGRPLPGQEQTYVEGGLLKPLPHLTCWKKGRKIPTRFHYGRNPRVPPIVCLSETGWYVDHGRSAAKPGKWDGKDGGAHGFDPRPAHAGGVRRPRPVVQVRRGVAGVRQCRRLSSVLARVTGVKPEKGDGSLKVDRARHCGSASKKSKAHDHLVIPYSAARFGMTRGLGL